MEIYLDGEDHTPAGFTYGSLPSGIAVNDLDLLIGRDYETGGYFDGTVDEVAVFNRALSPQEIQELYQMGEEGRNLEIDTTVFGDIAAGDYHLLSERGRYWPRYDLWVHDQMASPGVDGGDPAIPPGDEPMPNGGRINMGAYGGTPYASMSEWPIAGDLNRDGVVNMLDLSRIAESWLEAIWLEERLWP
jgi:hypothetical protein